VGVTGSGFVNTWYDQSGNGYDAIQGTTTKQPLVINSGSVSNVNSKPAMQLDSIDDSIIVPSSTSYFNFLHNGTKFLISSVSRINRNASSALLGNNGGATALVGIYILKNTNNKISANIFRGVGSTSTAGVTTTTNYNINTQNSLVIEGDVSNAIANDRLKIYINNSSANQGNTSTLTPSTGNASQNFQIGTFDGSSTMDGFYQELILWNSDQTSNRTSIESNINTNYKIYGDATASFDPDYQAFITATGITQPTQSAALETLVSDLKSYGLWPKMKAIYPMVTDKNNRFAQSEDFSQTWNPVSSSVTVNQITAPNGTSTADLIREITGSNPYQTFTVVNNGASAYTIDGSDNPTLTLERGRTYVFDINASGHPFYIMTGSGAYTVDGQYNTGVTGQGTQTGTLTFAVPNNAPDTLAYVCQFHSAMGATINVINNTDQHYVYQTVDTLVSGNEYVLSVYGRFLNRPWIALQTNDGAQAWFNLQTGVTGSFTGSRATITPVSGGWYRCALFYTASSNGAKNQHIHLSDADGNFNYTGVATTGSYLWGAQFENGNVLGPYKATTTTGFTTGSMLDQMKFNLRNPADTDAAFRLVYSGSWNGGYSGVKPDGTTAYADTKLIPSSSLTNNNTHISIYSRTDNLLNQIEIGSWPSSGNRLLMTLRYSSSGNFEAEQYKEFTSRVSASNSNSTGLYISSRTNNTTHKSYKNNIQFGSTNSGDPGSTTNINTSIWIGAVNTSIFRGYSTKEFGFSTIGDGLTDYQAKALYWIVQKFQTTLGRQVY
jgi:hypothetical protein